MFSDFEKKLMRKLIQKAKRSSNICFPNPVVAAAIYKNDIVISYGVTQSYVSSSGAHAEVIAIEKAGALSKDASLMVTLEPCTHTGRTPPCVNAIIKSGIKHVIFAVEDVNPSVRESPAKSILEQHGLSVRYNLCREAAMLINEGYFWRHRMQKPFVKLKVGMSLDGKIAMKSGESKYITSESSLKSVHRLRAQSHAIIIGAETIRKDDPQLDLRFGFRTKVKQVPSIIIISRFGKLSSTFRVFNHSQHANVIIVCEKTPAQRIEHVSYVNFFNHGELSWPDLLDYCYKNGLMELLIEGGARLYSSAISAGIVNQLICFIANKLIGQKDAISFLAMPYPTFLKDSIQLKNYKVTKSGDDLKIVANLI